MDFSKLSQTEKMAAIASAVLVIAGLVAVFSWGTYAVAWLGIVAALAQLAVIFMPQLSPSTTLPGSRGSLLAVTGGLAGLFMVLAFLTSLDFVFYKFGLADLLFLVAVVAGLAAAWFGWLALRAEGGKLQIGASAAPSSAAPPAAPTAPPPPAPPAAPPPPAAPGAPPAGSGAGEDDATTQR